MDIYDEYLHIGGYNWAGVFGDLLSGRVEAFNTTYLRKPNGADCHFLLDMHERVHDFPGFPGSIDCMH